MLYGKHLKVLFYYYYFLPIFCINIYTVCVHEMYEQHLFTKPTINNFTVEIFKPYK